MPYETVDVSCLVDIEGGKDLAMICVEGVDKMSVEEVASFIRGKTSKMKKASGGEEHKKQMKPFSFVPTFLVSFLIEVISFLTNKVGIQIKPLGLKRHAFGAACVTSLGSLGFEDATAPFTGTPLPIQASPTAPSWPPPTRPSPPQSSRRDRS